MPNNDLFSFVLDKLSIKKEDGGIKNDIFVELEYIVQSIQVDQGILQLVNTTIWIEKLNIWAGQNRFMVTLPQALVEAESTKPNTHVVFFLAKDIY